MYDQDVRDRAQELVRSGMSLNGVSKKLGISRAAIRDWISSPDSPGAPPCPAPAQPSSAYAALLGYYLGDGHISRYPRYYAMRISCDAGYEGIIRDIETVMTFVNPRRRTYRVQAPGCVVVQSHWKHWPCLFPQHGPGRKHERELGMTSWQWEIVQAQPAAFLRGLFHSDGCRVNNWATRTVGGQKRRYDYPRWQFVNASEEILRWCGEALDLLEIDWRRSGPRTISVSRYPAVARLDELIGLKS